MWKKTGITKYGHFKLRAPRAQAAFTRDKMTNMTRPPTTTLRIFTGDYMKDIGSCATKYTKQYHQWPSLVTAASRTTKTSLTYGHIYSGFYFISFIAMRAQTREQILYGSACTFECIAFTRDVRVRWGRKYVQML